MKLFSFIIHSAYLGLLCWAHMLLPMAGERITLFESIVTVDEQAVLHIEEHITVVSNQQAIRHGIVREIPTSFPSWGIRHQVDFAVQEVLLNNQPIDYHTASMANGKAIYLGSKEQVLTPGIYTFTLKYTLGRMIGFFPTYDELWLNVNGNGSRFPIEKVYARIMLPGAIPAKAITVEGYTGRLGSTARHCATSVQGNTISVYTTRPLGPYEGLSVVIAWPKGFIALPTWYQKVGYFIKDNVVLLWLILVLVMMVVYYCLAWLLRIKPLRVHGPIIPLFYPPAELLPGMVRYMYTMSFDSGALAAEIVNMAVNGLLLIEGEQGIAGSIKYKLTKREDAATRCTLHQDIMAALFAQSATVTIVNDENHEIIKKTLAVMERHCTRTVDAYFDTHGDIITRGMLGALIGLLPLLVIDPYVYELPWFWLCIMLLITVSVCFYYITRGYAPTGQRIYEAIAGFKLFLSATEQERFAILGTPPTKTPQLYETYLPYAMALGVEKAWSAQFAPMFNTMAASAEYTPLWYRGYYAGNFASHAFAHDIARGLNNSLHYAQSIRHMNISSSGTRPGSRSGAGGRGYSGGGGGGGGIGGW